MANSGKNFRLNKKEPRYTNKQLVSPEEESRIANGKLTFSFEHFNHNLNYFQIGDCQQKWFVGLLERLQTLGKMTKDEVLRENAGSRALRCHEIDWKEKNIPIQREELTWLPTEILANALEFPIMQISISKSTGRIIGFFDSNPHIFHVILLDPNHNLQPCKSQNYQIQPTIQGISQYDDLLNKMERIRDIIKNCPDKSCQLHSHIEHIDGLHDNIIYMGLNDDFYTEYKEAIKTHTLSEILERGILEILTDEKSTN